MHCPQATRAARTAQRSGRSAAAPSKLAAIPLLSAHVRTLVASGGDGRGGRALAPYDPTLTLREARARYFDTNGFGEDGGYTKRWVTGWIGPVPFAFPNVESRVRAVRFHDLHHLVTGYDTDFAGESQISAWEIASGCKRHLAAWLINLSALSLGLFFDAGALFRAFVRGRHSRNFYDCDFEDALLDETVGDARASLLPAGDHGAAAEPEPEVGSGDRAAFAFWMAVSVILVLLQAAVVLAPIAALLAWCA